MRFGRVIAGLGVAMAAAISSPDHSTATAAIRESSDALTQIALALSRAGDTGAALIEAATAVTARAELTQFAEHLADQTRTIPDHDHRPDRDTRIRRIRQAVLNDIGYLR